MSVEINKIDDELICHTFICNDTGKRMINVWARIIGDNVPKQTVEVCSYVVHTIMPQEVEKKNQTSASNGAESVHGIRESSARPI